MSISPHPAATRRSLLRAAVTAGPALAVAPIAAGALAEAASAAGSPAAPFALRVAAVRSGKRKKCKRVKLGGKVKVTCRRQRKKKQQPAPSPVTPPKPKVQTPAKPTPAKPAPKPPTPAPTPTPLPAASLLTAPDRHLVGRFSYGVDPALADQVMAAGGGAAWFESQLTTPGTSDPATGELIGWWPSLSRAPLDLWNRQRAGTELGSAVMADYQRLLLVRRVLSTRPVLDLMAEFWENHFNVPVGSDNVFPHRVPYGAALRAQALGRFEDLLQVAITHPAMLIYLNANVSTKTKPNENLGRELLELHSVGRDSYTEDDVKASARILTGYRVETSKTWIASYQTTDHYVGTVTVMGFTHPNTDPDGRAVTAAYLRYLAHHPATAQRVARKLAVKFVRDDPSQALVDQLARVYLDHDTSIAPVLRALVASAEFAAAVGAKIRDPAEDVVATYRALQVVIAPPIEGRPSTAAEKAILAQTSALGTTPHSWPQPDGAPIDNESWCSTARVLASLDQHYKMSQRSSPSKGVTYRTPAEWMPSTAVTFADLVEHLSRELLHLSAPPGLLGAACVAVQAGPAEVITAAHAVVKSRFAVLLTTILDSPLHVNR